MTDERVRHLEEQLEQLQRVNGAFAVQAALLRLDEPEQELLSQVGEALASKAGEPPDTVVKVRLSTLRRMHLIMMRLLPARDAAGVPVKYMTIDVTKT